MATAVFRLLRDLREGGHALDVLALLLPVGVMIGLSVAPGTIKQLAAFAHGQPTIIAAFSTHYLHLPWAALLNNLLIYLLVVPTTYMLGIMGDQRQLYFVVWLTVLVVFPFVLTASSLVIIREGTLSGFSAIGMALAGFLPVILTRYLSRQFRGPIDVTHSPGVFFLGVAVMTYLSVPSGRFQLLLAVPALIGLGYLWRPFREISRSRRGTIFGVSARSGYVGLVGLSLLAYVIVLVLGFHPIPDGDPSMIDRYLHVLGFSFGFIGSYITFRIDRRIDV